MEDNNKNWPKALANAVNLGTSVAVVIVLCLMGGKWLDDKFGMTPLFTIIGLILAVLTCGKMMWERLMADNKPSLPPDSQENETKKNEKS